ncbi:hypothetical protein FHR32_000324 [Streptosporangium album]|uniref:Uncharacterized protein n=1 Tax=Streptosporangium album TaxID=47479 RepID=A0A7W7RPX6_9ACTN|nr:hypothetical protein [Streptosporangium album]MBB4936019.1 hypothetical protein [Streptosporangium album]
MSDSKNFCISVTVPESWGRQVRVVILTIVVMVLVVAYGREDLLALLAHP